MIYLQGYSCRFDAKPKQNLKEYNSLMGRIIKVAGPPGEVLKRRAAVPYPLACPSFSSYCGHALSGGTGGSALNGSCCVVLGLLGHFPSKAPLLIPPTRGS